MPMNDTDKRAPAENGAIEPGDHHIQGIVSGLAANIQRFLYVLRRQRLAGSPRRYDARFDRRRGFGLATS